MKKLIGLLVCLIFLSSVVCAVDKSYKKSNLPEGTFKKSHSGKIIQYDKNGKKIGIYKKQQGRYLKIK